MSRVGVNIRKARQAAGMKQRQLGDHLDVLSVTVSRWERGVTEPRFDQLIHIAKVTGQPVSFFFAEDGVKEKVA